MSGHRQNGRKFGFTMAAVACIFLLISLYKHRVLAVATLGIVAVVFMLFALIAPKLLEPFETIWMGFAHVLGAINARIIMGLLYVLVFVPLGLIFKVIGRDQMRRRWASGAKTNWEGYRSRQRNLRHYENMF